MGWEQEEQEHKQRLRQDRSFSDRWKVPEKLGKGLLSVEGRERERKMTTFGFFCAGEVVLILILHFLWQWLLLVAHCSFSFFVLSYWVAKIYWSSDALFLAQGADSVSMRVVIRIIDWSLFAVTVITGIRPWNSQQRGPSLTGKVSKWRPCT